MKKRDMSPSARRVAARSLIRDRSRRDFARSLAAIAATPFVSGAAESLAVEPVTQTSQAGTGQAAFPESEPLTEFVRMRFGKHLTEEQLSEIKRSIERARGNSQRLRTFKLSNSDEPAFAFTAEIE